VLMGTLRCCPCASGSRRRRSTPFGLREWLPTRRTGRHWRQGASGSARRREHAGTVPQRV
jgi:hypothetical protein